ncbi:hypothetical protein BCR35DRAFT_305355 [Leucosporidium creatinivorum]|uniref:Glycosyltransferase family 25 protein n=1 Tax=Leucosporidium creatinivorum TaxID=106004 RepID=A0A1Y2F126_9BASI|nr:hypothetical protein BCR35DRAFT_305355 [Leucosporidium creatinivorum]
MSSSSAPSLPQPTRRLLLAGLSLLLLVLLLSTASLHPKTSERIKSWTTSSTTPSASSLSIPGSSFLSDPTQSLSYRQHLESTTSSPSSLIHSPTLGFSHIYVLSLPSRLDRRQQMSKLAKALGVEITFVDAHLKDESWVRWVAERVEEVRRERRAIMAKARNINPSSIGGLQIGNDWLVQTPSPNTSFPSGPTTTHPSLSSTSPRSWVDVLEEAHATATLHKLTPTNPRLNITSTLWDPLETIAGRQVNEGVISTFFGHTRAIKKVVENGDESALILEDDVDVEWDLERVWSRVRRRLPGERERELNGGEGTAEWDVSFLGHCWGRELLNPSYLHPLLHRSTAPLCLHAYALTQRGASRALSLLNNPWTAYSTAVDTAIPSFISFGQDSTGSLSPNGRLLEAFSVDPPLIIQRKDGPSDIQAGVGSKWRGFLSDSTVERIKRSEGEWTEEEEREASVWDESRGLDPATTYRYGARRCHA